MRLAVIFRLKFPSCGVDELPDDLTVQRSIGWLGMCSGVPQDDSIRRRWNDHGAPCEDPAD